MDWRSRQPHRLDGRGGIVPVDRERGVQLLYSLGVDPEADTTDGIPLGDSAEQPESALLEQLEQELASGVLMLRVDRLPTAIPWRVSAETLPALEAGLLKWHSATTRLDRVFARPEPLSMAGEGQAGCPLIVVRGVRVGGALIDGRPRGTRTVPAGSEGRLICGDLGLGELVAELRSGTFVVRIPSGSNAVVLFEARARRRSVLFPHGKPYRRALGQLAKLEERLYRKAAR